MSNPWDGKLKATAKDPYVWEIEVKGLPTDVNGKRQRPRKTVRASSVDEALDKAWKHFGPIYPELLLTGTLIVRDALVWCIIRAGRSGHVTPSASREYRAIVDRYIDPKLKRSLQEISRNDLRNLYDHLHRRGGKNGQGLSVKTLRKLNSSISCAYDYLIDRGALKVNPTLRVKFPKDDAIKLPRVFTESELALFVDSIDVALGEDAFTDGEINRKSALFGAYVALLTGMRVGELCGLTRGDISMTDNAIHVRCSMSEEGGLHEKPPKTKSSLRTVAMSEKLSSVITELLSWKSSFLTKAQCLSDKTPVFCKVDGSHLAPSFMSRTFKAFCLESGIELGKGESIHLLRHTHASFLLAIKENPKAIQERLGHSNSSTLLDYYAHLMPGEGDAVASSVDNQIDRVMKAGGYR